MKLPVNRTWRSGKLTKLSTRVEQLFPQLAEKLMDNPDCSLADWLCAMSLPYDTCNAMSDEELIAFLVTHKLLKRGL